MPLNKMQIAAQRSLTAVQGEAFAITPAGLSTYIQGLQILSEVGEIPAMLSEIDSRFGPAGDDGSRMQVAGGVATIPVVGAIRPRADVYSRWFGATACSQIQADLRAAIANDDVKKIVLLIDSPGGSVFGLEETATAIFQARGKKPIHAVVDGLCASAAYFIGSSAETMEASPSSTVGSIGTILIHQDFSKAFQDWGITATPITFGKHKADGSPYKPLDAQGKATMQEWIDSYGEQFVAAVGRNRGVSPDEVRSKFGDGKVFIASLAVERGLIDSISGESNDGATNAAAVSSTVAESINATNGAGQSAGANVGPKPTADVVLNGESKVKISAKIKALLFAIGLIGSVDAEDEKAESALVAFFAGRGTSVPKNESGGMDEEKILNALRLNGPSQTQSNAAPNVQSAHDREMAEARTLSPAQVNQIRNDVKSSAELINSGRRDPLVSAEMVDAATTAIIEGKKNPSRMPVRLER